MDPDLAARPLRFRRPPARNAPRLARPARFDRGGVPIIWPIARAGSVGRGLARDVVEVFVLALVLYLLAISTVQTVHVVGLSMYPSLDNNDLLIASKVDYRLHAPERGDIVILRDPLDPSRDFIKRVVAVPGDHLLIRDHRVLINGQPLDEPYVAQWAGSGSWPSHPDSPDGEVVPPDSFFVMGDNRDHSSDSRLFGYVTRDEIQGRAFVRVWPFAHVALLDTRPYFAKS